MDQDSFYTQLPLRDIPVSKLLGNENLFVPVPSDWYVVITDIKGSTQAVNAGMQEQVNLIATGSIIAAINLANEKGLGIPFFFGGDGATILAPPSLIDTLLASLSEHKGNTLRNFDLDLRVGHMQLAQVYQAGHSVQIARTKLNAFLHVPIVLGEGLHYAEGEIKSLDKEDLGTTEDPLLNLEGMECKWNRIKPPKDTSEVLCLLIDSIAERDQGLVFQKIMEAIDRIYGDFSTRQPISENKLNLNLDLQKVMYEARIKYGALSVFRVFKEWFATFLGKFFFFPFFRSGKSYLKSLVQLADTFVVDGRINTVISGTIQQREELLVFLNQLEDHGSIQFGYYASEESIMSCYVRDRENQHIHFVDGTGGGYTQAAKMLKAKKKEGAHK